VPRPSSRDPYCGPGTTDVGAASTVRAGDPVWRDRSPAGPLEPGGGAKRLRGWYRATTNLARTVSGDLQPRLRLAAHTHALTNRQPEAGLRVLRDLGVCTVELACAGVFRDHRYGDPAILLASDRVFAAWRDMYKRNGITIGALSIHGEPLSPIRDVAETYAREFRTACRLAERMGVRRLSLRAGLPEGAPGDQHPCWIVGRPREFTPRDETALRWQWEDRLLPYWSTAVVVAAEHGCELAFEMQAWDMVYNPRTMLELRAALGPIVRCNFDPSHMWYQGIDPLEAIDALAGVISTVHAKDTVIDARLVGREGLFDLTPLTAGPDRIWTFAVPGVGHDATVWRAIIEKLQACGYHADIAIEHEDPDVDPMDGIEQAVRFLSPLLTAT
jgi:sugar phosphate isomerase/epimerase